jgi:hypothetical protein
MFYLSILAQVGIIGILALTLPTVPALALSSLILISLFNS